jgi:hypothetical protein
MRRLFLLLTVLACASAVAEPPVDLQRQERLNRSADAAFDSLQQRKPVPFVPGLAEQQRERQRQLQESQRREVLRRHYRGKLMQRQAPRPQLDGLARQRLHRAEQADQLRRFEGERDRLRVPPADRWRRPPSDPLAPLRR